MFISAQNPAKTQPTNLEQTLWPNPNKPPPLQNPRPATNPNVKEGGKEYSTPPWRRLGPNLVGLMGSQWADGFQVDGLCDFQVDVLSHV